MTTYEAERQLESHEDELSDPGSDQSAIPEPVPLPGSAAFQAQYAGRDMAAGLIAGSMAIPLTVGIAMMSEYPIKVGLATVAFACLIGWINAWFKPGNYIGCPGIAAGLAPVLAVGVATFGLENMAFAIFLTATFQAIIWKFNWQRYILVAVPVYLVEGLLAGVGLKIALKFLTFTYELPPGMEAADSFLNGARIQMILISMVGYGVFVALFLRFKKTQPCHSLLCHHRGGHHPRPVRLGAYAVHGRHGSQVCAADPALRWSLDRSLHGGICSDAGHD